MFRIMLIMVFTAIVLFGGTISGELSYPGGGLGAYAVMVIDPATIASIAMGDSIDFASLPIAPLFMPGEYSIDGDFTDGMPYTVFGVKLEDMSTIRPQSGDPMGLYPEDVYTFGGSATDIDVELATEGPIGGHIDYAGDISVVKMNVYDVMAGSLAVLEGVYPVGDSPDYSVTVPSGFKRLEFFADLNGNDNWDRIELEPGTIYSGIGADMWGPIVFAGGGDKFATGVDVFIPNTDVSEIKSNVEKFSIKCTPNPFNSTAVIKFYAPENAVLTVSDISGKVIQQRKVSGSGELKIGENLCAGAYLVSLCGKGVVLNQRISFIK